MDKQLLVKRLREVFNAEKQNGLYIDQYGLAPAFRGLSSNSFVLGISAPSLVNETSSNRTRIIFNALHKYLNDEEKMSINRIRVFDNVEDLKLGAVFDFEGFDSDYNKCVFIPDLHEVA
ncbi:hypothetical protein [Dyadobacter sp. CY347]|uniref:hypothetical protein n=1 Tax=Dyadobacter sp. CY347 TaxID=2909336 RepID=UPI001F3EDDDE|nr:hypothetical protein [Dyadobacter sp. CY347]MCF2488139.1 hypothetical protein [Dyadobacter sp. CY347]